MSESPNTTGSRRVKGLLSASFTVLSLLTALSCCRAPGRPNVLLIIIDTVRADALGCYGSRVMGVSPTIDSLAYSGAVWERCQSQSPWTLPTLATILTGLTERRHRAGLEDDIYTGLDPRLPYMPRIMSEAGYRTCGVFNCLALSPEFGFDRGFEHYVFIMPGEEGDAARCVDSLLAWLSTGGDQPFFAVLHIYDAHMPYSPPPPYDTLYRLPGDTLDVTTWVMHGNTPDHPEQLEHFRSLYYGEITWVDSQLSRVFAHLRASGVADRTLVILTADHGEEFLEHGCVEHGHTLFEELLRVPLVISGPGFPSGVRNSIPAAHIDIATTIYALCGITVEEELLGVDLRSPEIVDRHIPASGVIHPGLTAGLEPLAAVTRGGIKTILLDGEVLTMASCSLSGYNELVCNFFEPSKADIDALLEYWSRPSDYIAPVVTVEKVRSQLRDLGYI